MKKTLWFSVVWTIFATIGAYSIWNDASWADEAPIVRRVLSTLPLFGLFFIWWSWRRFRRYQSVRVVESDAGVAFYWTDLNGEEKQSGIDPRLQWDEDDRLDDT